MNYYKTTIQYIGTNYSGFQWQDGFETVQSEYNSALSKILNGSFSTMAASRTDRGVHAAFQIVKVTTENEIDQNTFVKNLNQVLSKDIRCLEIVTSEKDFKPASFASSKEYRYFFTNQKIINLDHHQFIANISNTLDIDSLLFCVNEFIGEHDFCNFYSEGSNVKTTIRKIFECELKKINPHQTFQNSELFKMPDEITECYELRIVANGFLKQMIRHIVSSLWLVGSGKISRDEFLIYLNGPKVKKQLWKVASSNGLFLYKINS